MRLLLLFLTAPVLAAIGDPCPNGDECSPSEFCATDEDGTRYCSARCPAEGCPEGFWCRESPGGVRACERGLPPEPAGFGEACGREVATCGDELFCTGTPDDTYCTSICNGPGTCPAGWSCRPIQGRAGSGCARLSGPPGLGDVCGDAEPRCTDGLTCETFGGAELCSRACEPGEGCGSGLGCEDGLCAPPAPTTSGIGGPCVPGAMPEGCENGLYCFTEGADAYCTGPCDGVTPCPAGYGCVEVSALEGECRRGQPTDPIFDPMGVDPGEIVDPPPPPPTADAGMGADEAADEGCDCGATGAAPLLWLFIAGRRRRRGGP